MTLPKVAELLYDVSARYLNTNEDVDLAAGIVVEILDEYVDDGMWSDDNPLEFETPFPAFVFRYGGLKYCSVHKNCFKTLE